MALTSGSISSGRGKVNDVKNELNEVKVIVNNFKNFLSHDANFNKFIEGTNIGKTQNEKIQTILGLLDQNLTAQTNSLIMRLNSFFDNQEELNRKAIMQGK